jgi:hypothetical protein
MDFAFSEQWEDQEQELVWCMTLKWSEALRVGRLGSRFPKDKRHTP